MDFLANGAFSNNILFCFSNYSRQKNSYMAANYRFLLNCNTVSSLNEYTCIIIHIHLFTCVYTSGLIFKGTFVFIYCIIISRIYPTKVIGKKNVQCSLKKKRGEGGINNKYQTLINEKIIQQYLKSYYPQSMMAEGEREESIVPQPQKDHMLFWAGPVVLLCVRPMLNTIGLKRLGATAVQTIKTTICTHSLGYLFV